MFQFSCFFAFPSNSAQPHQNSQKANTVALKKLSSVVQNELCILRRAHNAQTVTMGLPIEILVHIFRFAGLSDPEVASIGVEEETFQRDTKIAIVSTCSHWRKVALSDPLLWQVIFIPCELLRRKPLIYNHVELEITRCGNTMISFKVQASPEEMSFITPLLQSNLHRIDKLEISWVEDISIESFCVFNDRSDTTLQSLRRLRLSSITSSLLPNSEEIYLTSAVSLKELWIENDFDCRDPDTLDLLDSWKIHPPSTCILELIRLYGWIPAGVVVDLVNSCTRLRSLVWCTTNVEEEREEIFRLKPLPTLENLRIGGIVSLSWLTAIVAPNLNHLHLSPPQRSASASDKLIPDVSFPRLETLIIERINDASSIIRFLQNHPSLRVLELQTVELTSELCQYLGSSTARDSTSTGLEILSIDARFLSLPAPVSGQYPSMLEGILKNRSLDTLACRRFELYFLEFQSRYSCILNRDEAEYLLTTYGEMFKEGWPNVFTDWQWPS